MAESRSTSGLLGATVEAERLVDQGLLGRKFFRDPQLDADAAH
jgi:hypothetical protein